MNEETGTLEGPPWGGLLHDAFCCGERTTDRRRLEENRGQYRSVHKFFVVGDWRCQVHPNHRGTLPPMPHYEGEKSDG